MRIEINRRKFLSGTAGMAGLCLFGCKQSVDHLNHNNAESNLGVYLSILSDGSVTFTTPNAEMGQGTFDALAKILVDELDASWGDVTVKLSGADKAMANPNLFSQVTGNSEAIRGYYTVLRNAGAAARMMLIQAAAQQWDVESTDCRVEDSKVYYKKKHLSFGELSESAAELPVPENIELKKPDDFKLIGHDLPRKETASKITGQAQFGIDVDLPDMMIAALALPVAAWGKVQPIKEFDITDREGVHSVVPVLGGYAVIANDFWTAKTAADTLQVDVDSNDINLPKHSDLLDDIAATLKAEENSNAVLFSGASGAKDIKTSLANVNENSNNDTAISLEYSVPYLAHGALEPLCCTVHFTENSIEVWAPTQNPNAVQIMAAKMSALPIESVIVHRTFLGGGFGRKWHTDFIQQAIEAAKAIPGTPVKLIWTREQDTQHDFYRPACMSLINMSFDREGNINSWKSVIAGQSLARKWQSFYKEGMPDKTLQKLPVYELGITHIESRAVENSVPIGYWRSVAHMPTSFFIESAMDEAALKHGKDPVAYRLAHLKDQRARQVLITLNEMIDSASSMVANSADEDHQGYGVALTPGYGSYCAVGAKISLRNNTLTVLKIWAVVDCGLAIDPLNVKRQVEGAISYGLGPALDGEVVFENGVAQASNINDIGASTPYDFPDIEVRLLPSSEAPGGVGELGTPGIAPALCNAIVASGGKRIRNLPISKSGLIVTV